MSRDAVGINPDVPLPRGIGHDASAPRAATLARLKKGTRSRRRGTLIASKVLTILVVDVSPAGDEVRFSESANGS